MQIRPITSPEIARYGQMEIDAFVLDQSEHSVWIEANKNPDLENIRGLFNDDHEMVSVLGLNYPQLWLGEKPVQIIAIYGVATSVENRRGGNLRQLLTGVLQEHHDKGYNLAALYPFYFPFYKKFGFEQVSTSKWVTVNLKQLHKFRSQGGQWKQVGPDQWEVFSTIYQQFCQGKFGQLTRDQQFWQRELFQRGNAKPNNLYLYYDQAGQPQAYLISHITNGRRKEREFNVQFAWTNPVAYYEILAFLANFDSQVKKVKWYAPQDENTMALVADPREVEEVSESGYMLRILDVPKALEERVWPRSANGSFFLKVTDDLFEWNNLTLRLDYHDGQMKVTPVEAETETAGANLLSCEVRKLSQLYAGFLTPKFMVQFGLLEASSPEVVALAQALFTPEGQPASHMADFF